MVTICWFIRQRNLGRFGVREDFLGIEVQRHLGTKALRRKALRHRGIKAKGIEAKGIEALRRLCIGRN
jgi:hypothetical protein